MSKLADAALRLEDAKSKKTAAANALRSVNAKTPVAELERLNAELDAAERVEQTAEHDYRVAIAAESSPKPVSSMTVTRNEPVYRKDNPSVSYFADLYRALKDQDPEAQDRLRRNHNHVEDIRRVQGEVRVVDNTAGAGFNPPIWMANEWAEYVRPGRPIANRMPSLPMPPDGLTAHIPKVSTGVTVDVQANEGDAVSSTDITSTTADANLVTLAGQQDVDRQILERSLPGLDMVLFQDLINAYDAKLDQQVIAGTGSNGQHLGIRAVSGVNAITYTSGSPTGAEFLTYVYQAISKIYSTRFMAPTAIYMHPRRAAWLAATQVSAFPLFQQGGLFHAAGSQDNGIVGTFAGLPVIADANIGTTYGASTNQDEVYVVYEPDFRLAEGDLRQATYEDVLSGNLAVRLQLFAFSFFFANRQPKSIAIISGTGLAAPSGF